MREVFALGPAAARIVPHAGFAYSGPVAASAFARIAKNRFDRILVMGPSRSFGFRGAAVPDAATSYRTPLGDTPIDRAAVSTLRGAAGFRPDDRMFESEPTVEATLPFLQRICDPEVPIVSVLLGGQTTGEDVLRVAEALAPVVASSTLPVVSSDFTHFGKRFGYTPFSNDIPARIRKLDVDAIDAIETGDAASGARLIEYDASGRMTGSWENSVSYAAIASPSPQMAMR